MPIKRFYSGPKEPLDPRIHAFRDDLADEALRGLITASAFAVPVAWQCSSHFTPMMDMPGGEQCSELLSGEQFMVLAISGGWAWGWSAHDHYVGYVATSALELAHLPQPELVHGDLIETAIHFLGRPYVWGGRGGAGIDCSGLVQRAAAAAGIKAMRDSDMQRDTLGRLLDEAEPVKRGDALFFPGHVGLALDSESMIHATIFHGKTVIEPLAIAVPRIEAKNDGVGIVARRRIVE